MLNWKSLIPILLSLSANANECDVNSYLKNIFQAEDPHRVGMYYQYGSNLIPNDIYTKAISELPVIKTHHVEADIIEHYKKVTHSKGKFELVAPNTAPTSGATVYMIQKDGVSVAVAKIYGDDFHALFREATASDFLKKNQISSSNIFGEANFVVNGTPKAFSFLTLAKGKDINLEIAEASDAFKKLSPLERERFSTGYYKNSEKIDSHIQEAKEQYSHVALASENSAKELARIHKIEPGIENHLEEVTRRRNFLLKKSDRQISDLLSLSDEGYATSDELHRLAEEIKKDIQIYESKPIQENLISVTHGDAHTGNFMVDQHTSQVTMIDNQSLVNSFAAGNGAKGVNESTIDLALLMESIAVKSKNNGFTDSEVRFLQQKAMRGYLQERKMTFSEVSPSLNFHRLRFDMIIATGRGNNVSKMDSQAALHELLVRYKIRTPK
jgi:thiamine kinase-like enzyme